MNITKRIKTIGISSLAVTMIASMSMVAFASNNQKTSNVTGEKVKVYDMKKKEMVDIDKTDLDKLEKVQSVAATAAIASIGRVKGDAIKVGKSVKAPGEKIKVYDMKKNELVDIDKVDLKNLESVEAVPAIKAK